MKLTTDNFHLVYKEPVPHTKKVFPLQRFHNSFISPAVCAVLSGGLTYPNSKT